MTEMSNSQPLPLSLTKLRLRLAGPILFSRSFFWVKTGAFMPISAREAATDMKQLTEQLVAASKLLKGFS